jgi:hypothetical protein
MLLDGFPKRRHGRIVNADTFQALICVPDIIEIRAPDSCGFDNDIRLVGNRHGIIDQIMPFVDEDLGDDCTAILKLNGKRAPLAGLSPLKAQKYLLRLIVVLECERNAPANLTLSPREVQR